jgi:fimbrial chaperone protein
MKRPIQILLTVLFLALLRINPALAFQFQPISQVFSPSGTHSTRTYQVINNQEERIAVEISVVERQMSLDGEETYQPAEDDFLIYPAQMILGPGATQVVRVSWLGDPAPDQELAFRLIAEQLPINLVDASHPAPMQAVGQVKVLLRYMGSLFVRPAGVQAALSLGSVTPSTTAQGAPAVALTFVNQGNASARLHGLRLTLTAQGQSVTLSPEQLEGIEGTTILPGHSRRYSLPRPANLPQGPLTATFDYRRN